MSNISVGKFLDGINKLLIPLKGRKMEMGDFHREVNNLTEDYLNDYPKIRIGTWVLNYNGDDINLWDSGENLFTLDLDITRDKRIKYGGTGKINDVKYKPNFHVENVSDEIILQISLHDYINEAKIQVLEKRVKWWDGEIAERRKKLDEGEQNRLDLLKHMYSLRESDEPLYDILSDINECPSIDREVEVISGIRHIRYFKSGNGSHRFIFEADGLIISAIQVMADTKSSQSGRIKAERAVVARVYTLKDFRLKGFARLVYSAAKAVFPQLEHSTDLTSDGKEFVKHIG